MDPGESSREDGWERLAAAEAERDALKAFLIGVRMLCKVPAGMPGETYAFALGRIMQMADIVEHGMPHP